LWAVISFSIFIASMMQIRAPSSTAAPCSTSTLKTLPCSGEESVSPPPPPPPEPDRSRRGRGAAGADEFPAGAAIASPSTVTSNRFPDTSTV
jgi:hypothetical protein